MGSLGWWEAQPTKARGLGPTKDSPAILKSVTLEP